jgi:hypothetical protein
LALRDLPKNRPLELVTCLLAVRHFVLYQSKMEFLGKIHAEVGGIHREEHHVGHDLGEVPFLLASLGTHHAALAEVGLLSILHLHVLL